MNGRTFPIIADKQLLLAARFSLRSPSVFRSWIPFICEIQMEWAGPHNIRWHSTSQWTEQEQKLLHLTSLVLYTLQATYGTVIWFFNEGKWSIDQWQVEHSNTSDMNHQGVVTYGADPEWLALYAYGQAIRLDQYFARNGRVGFDSVRSNGVDWPVLLELRPQPVHQAIQLIDDMREQLAKAYRTLVHFPNLKLFAGAYPMKGIPLGGHIHIKGFQPTQAFIRLLDQYLTFPLCAIESVHSRNRRPRFGRLGDVKAKDLSHFEYRTLPNWMVEPVIAKGVLTVVQLVVRSADEGLKSKMRNQLEDRQQWWADVFAYYYGQRVYFQKMLCDWYRSLVKICDDQTEYTNLNRFYERLKSGKPWNEQVDQFPLWDLDSI